jgi:hypothetical protein
MNNSINMDSIISRYQSFELPILIIFFGIFNLFLIKELNERDVIFSVDNWDFNDAQVQKLK